MGLTALVANSEEPRLNEVLQNYKDDYAIDDIIEDSSWLSNLREQFFTGIANLSESSSNERLSYMYEKLKDKFGFLKIPYKTIAGATASALILGTLLGTPALASEFGDDAEFNNPPAKISQPSKYKKPTIKKYTPAETDAVVKKFESNPAKYSNEMGNLLLSKLYSLHPRFAEFSELPEIRDGIHLTEEKWLNHVYQTVRSLNLNDALFSKEREMVFNQPIILSWQGNSDKPSDFSGSFEFYDNLDPQNPLFSQLIKVVPQSFELGDSVDYEHLKKTGDLKWTAYASKKDTGSLVLDIQTPDTNQLMIFINGRPIRFTKEELTAKEKLVFNEDDGMGGIVTVKYGIQKFPSQEAALADMINAGEGNKYSAVLQAWLWQYQSGMIKDSDNPLVNYEGILPFVKKAWGDMNGTKWKKIDNLTMVNLPELTDYFTRNKIKYEFYVGPRKTNQGVIEDGKANCYDTSELIRDFLQNAGYKSGLIKVESSVTPEGHIIPFFYVKDKIYLINNGTIIPKGIEGHFDSFEKTPYRFIGFR